jgi:hypothetical protein
MKQEMLKERVELLAIGEVLGYPRLGIGHSNGTKHSIKAGQPGWEQFAGHAHTTRIPAALRIGRILRDNGVTPYNPKAERYVIKIDEPMPELIAIRPTKVILLDDPLDSDPVIAAKQADEMVKPKRSSAAVRQARYRANKKKP